MESRPSQSTAEQLLGLSSREAKQRSPIRLVDIFQLDPQENTILKERIGREGDSIDILVHPYYPTVRPYQDPSREYLEERDRAIVHSLGKDNKPLIVFEQIAEVERLAERIQTDQEGTLYIVPTKANEPTPILGSTTEQHTDEIAWSQVENTFHSLGVKHVTIGGRYLYFASLEDSDGIPDVDMLSELRELKELAKDKPHALEWLNRNYLPYGCAGTAAKQLLRLGFDVSLSSISTPDKFM